MAEPGYKETKQIAEIFLLEYNTKNKTSFIWKDSSSYQPHEPYDFVLFDNSKELGVQLVRTVADYDREFVRPKNSETVVEELIKIFKDRSPAVRIYINFEKPPIYIQDKKKLLFWLEYFISYKLDNNDGNNYYIYDKKFDDEYLSQIKDYISELVISTLNDRDKGVSIIFGWNKPIPEPWLDDQRRVVRTVLEKEKKFKNIYSKFPELILLIDSGSSPMADFYVDMTKNELKGSLFKEIWLVDNFVSQKRAIKLK